MDPAQCAACHGEIAERFARTGMGRSVSPAESGGNRAAWSAGVFVHERSRRTFEPRSEDGRFFLRRFQARADGLVENQIEREVHWVVGSGNHAQTFLHRSGPGKWIELPLSWYAEGGGAWAMSPGYDQPQHAGFRRVLDGRCLFCHAAYRSDDAPDEPQPIDCQRCHGPGSLHVAAMTSDPGGKDTAIVNPARLDPDRSLEVCLQCHLQSTSRPLPDALLRFGRDENSFRPGEPLGDFRIAFDHAEDSPQREKFEVNGAGYQMLRSACFRSSGAGKLNCRTCHDPHGDESVAATRERASAACRNCHSELAPEHPTQPACLDCHMPKRRTEDAVHVAMHDHSVPRTPPEADWREPVDELAAAEASAYSGEIELFYPPDLPARERELYLAVAQVRDAVNLESGIRRLESAVRAGAPPGAHLALAEAYRRTGECASAVPHYRLAAGAEPGDRERFLAECLLRLGQIDQAREELDAALASNPKHAGLLLTAGVAAGQGGELDRSLEFLRGATDAAPEASLVWLNLGASLEAAGQIEEAEQAYRQAVNAQPDHPFARTHLATLLLGQGRAGEGLRQLEQCLADRPRFAPALLQRARLAADQGDPQTARRYYEQAAQWGTEPIREAALRESAGLPQ